MTLSLLTSISIELHGLDLELIIPLMLLDRRCSEGADSLAYPYRTHVNTWARILGWAGILGMGYSTWLLHR